MGSEIPEPDELIAPLARPDEHGDTIMARHQFAAASRALGTAETLDPDLLGDTFPATVREAQEPAGLDARAFPDLDGDDEQRMEDLVAARLFPRQAAALRIGRYTLLDRLGQGGMGVVYAAYDPELDRRVAIKLLTASLVGHAEQRLLREAQAMARVVHANVVSVIEVGQHQGQSYVVMEYVRGISLDRWPERRPGWRETLRVYIQAGRGLAAAHRAGVIHRDFKPHNVMLVEGGPDDGRVKVLDFGLARAALHEPTVTTGEDAATGALALPLTRTGAVMGTPAYMAPEQLAAEPVSARSDQFSFAVSLYEALYGQLPFAATTLPALTVAVLTGAIRPVPATSDVPTWALRIVLRGLARAPEDRFVSMTEICDALERDPAARRRTVGLALTLSAVVGLGGWGVAQLGNPSASPCSGPAFELGDVWSDARATAMAAAFVATGLPYAADAARRVKPILGDYVNAWSAMRRGTCEAHQRGEQSAQLLDLRMACLDRRRAGLVALGELLVQADGAVVEHAVEAALELPSLAGCADAEALTAATPLPEDPTSARAVEVARDQLAEIDALASAGRFTTAATSAAKTLVQAEALGFQPLIAESALTLGAIALEQGRGDEADRALTLAVRHGIAARADRTAAEALIRRFFVRGALLGQRERAAAEEELLAAHAARFPHDGALQWLAHNNRGAVAHGGHDLDRAREHYRRALAITDGPTPLDLARTRTNLGLLEFDVRDFAAAQTAYHAAVTQASAALGEAHPLVGQLATYEATALAKLGRHAEAQARLESAAIDTPWSLILRSRLDARRRRFEAARAGAARALAATDASDPLTLINAEAALADAVTDPAEALAHYASVLARCEATYGEQHPTMASFLQRAAIGSLRLERPAEALEQLRRALAIGEALADLAATGETHRLLADASLALGETDAALASARAAVTTLSALPGDHTLDLALARRSLGAAHLARREADLATEALRLALSALETRLDADDPDLAQTRVLLARALLAADPTNTTTARPLLARARDAYLELGEPFALERASAEQRLIACCTR